MCYHLSIHANKESIANKFELAILPEKNEKIRYHINAFDFPKVGLVMQQSPLLLNSAHWGLIPNFVKSEAEARTISNNTINAKSETLFVRASFKDSIQNNKCVIFVDGFFEWQKQGQLKIPYYIYAKDKSPLALAGLYNTWNNPETGEKIDTFSIITKAANPLMESIHNSKKRMPAILEHDQIKDWLRSTERNKINQFLEPNEHSNITAHTVNLNLKSNNLSNPKVIDPYQHPKTAQQSLF